MRPAFVFSPDLCTGCEACRVACGNENNEGRDTGWRQVVTFNPARHPALPALHLSIACNHCEIAACAISCPARAYRRDELTGAVLIDDAKCIGCRYCSWVCPYDAPQFDEQAGLMSKCTFCVHRLEASGSPACVAACPTGALTLGERPSPAMEPAFHGLGTWGLGPSLRIVAPRRAGPPEGLLPDNADDPAPPLRDHARKITLRKERGLFVFTLVMPALAAWFAGGLRIPTRAPATLPFLVIAALAFAISTAHLGQPLRAWRAILGLRSSWLSREVFATGLFVTLAALTLALPQAPPGLALAALVAGMIAVIAMDGVYLAIPRAAGPRLHGAETTTAFLLLFGIAADWLPLALLAAAIKALLMAARVRSGALGMPVSAAALRKGLLGAAIVAAFSSLQWPVAFALALASEAIDRAAFYNALEPTAPSARMEAEAYAALAAKQDLTR